MDLRTAVVLMMLNLATTGALVALVARRNQSQHPLLYCGASTGLFALGYALRLSLGLASDSPWVLPGDVLMVLACVLFLHGQRRFMHRQDGGLGRTLMPVALYAVVHTALVSLGGQVARHVSLNAALATLYLAMAFTAWQGQRTLPEAERPPQRLMTVMAGTLGLITALRMVDALVRGVEPLFQGPTAQAYYGLSSICVLLMCPAMLWWMFMRMNDQLRQMATHDPLTGALNRNGLVQAVRRHFAARTPVPLVWLMADIDHFKRVNDGHGHAVGDQLLKAVAQSLMTHVRGADFVARLGGEEFLVALAGLTQTQALELANRLRTEVAALQLALSDGKILGTTISLGVSRAFLQADDWETALQGADSALYGAKAAGRNQAALA